MPQSNTRILMTQYTVSDGKIVLTLQEAEEGGYVVTSDSSFTTEHDMMSG